MTREEILKARMQVTMSKLNILSIDEELHAKKIELLSIGVNAQSETLKEMRKGNIRIATVELF